MTAESRWMFVTPSLHAGLMALFLAFACNGTAAAQTTPSAPGRDEPPYDPSTCKTNAHGNIYIALGKYVFAFPSSGSVLIARYGKDWLKPPDPAEPIGCPGNPEQLTGYAFPYAYNAVVRNPDSTFANAQLSVSLLQLIHFHANADPPSPDDTAWRSEQSQLGLAESLCRGDALRRHPSAGWSISQEELPSGFTACRLKHGDVEKRIEDERTGYIARADIYKTPFDRPFIVNCRDQAYTIPTGDDCRVAYVLRAGLGIIYSFNPYHEPRALPIDRVIEFDRGLRAAIVAALQDDFRWAK